VNVQGFDRVVEFLDRAVDEAVVDDAVPGASDSLKSFFCNHLRGDRWSASIAAPPLL